jgi:multisubunit Na+/H+ antiporter MnhB subunit
MDALIIGLTLLVVLGAVVALQLRDLLAGVIGLGVVGLGVAIVFLLLGAPDIAITQVVVEVIVVAALIRVCSRLAPQDAATPRLRAGAVAGVGLALVSLGFVVWGLMELPAFGSRPPALAEWYLAHAAAATGAANAVTAVLLDFRAYDTLGEATVILTAVAGTLVVLRHRSATDRAPVETAHPLTEAGVFSPIVGIVARWMVSFVLILGLAVAFYGHLTPGGGFAGGVIIACAFVLATLAFGAGQGAAAAFGRVASSLDAVGAIALLVLALAGFTAGSLLQQWVALGEPFRLGSTPSLVLLNLAILLKVGAGLFAAFLAVASFRRGPPDEEGATP